jgi:ABC-type dipeptide/oligopeptide/nickel transport system ATPase component
VSESRTALPDLAAMADYGARIAAQLRAGDVVALEGGLGAGKTTLARAILTALGHQGEVPSPTFTIIEAYDAPRCGCRWCMPISTGSNTRMKRARLGSTIIVRAPCCSLNGPITQAALRMSRGALSSCHRNGGGKRFRRTDCDCPRRG